MPRSGTYCMPRRGWAGDRQQAARPETAQAHTGVRLGLHRRSGAEFGRCSASRTACCPRIWRLSAPRPESPPRSHRSGSLTSSSRCARTATSARPPRGPRLAAGHDLTARRAQRPMTVPSGLWTTGTPAPDAVRGSFRCPAEPRAAARVGEVEDSPSGAGARPRSAAGHPAVQVRGGPPRGGLPLTGDGLAARFLADLPFDSPPRSLLGAAG